MKRKFGLIIFISTILLVTAEISNTTPDSFKKERKDAGGSKKATSEKNKPLEKNNSCPAGMAFIAPGKFVMGCSAGDNDCGSNESPAHEVTLTKAFCMDKYLVKHGEYEKKIGLAGFFIACGPDCPIDTVTWHEAKNYCEKTGKRLPTEAEWEYAARAGTTTRYYWGNSMDGDYAWYHANSQVDYFGSIKNRGTHPAGKKKPNAYGLYDMAGNVLEWVNDWYGKYPGNPVTDPTGPLTGSSKVLRGGSWFLAEKRLRVSSRNGDSADNWSKNFNGFRCARNF